MREVLRHLTETGPSSNGTAGGSPASRWKNSGSPEGVREVVGRRLSRLSGEANRVLRAGGGRRAEFELGHSEQPEGFDEENLLAALEEAPPPAS